jgi:hypothetical protein
MRVKEFIFKKYEDSKGARDFRIPTSVHENYLNPIMSAFKEYNVEMTEIILYAIALAVKDRIKNNRKSDFNAEKSKESTALFGIPSLDPDRLEFFVSVVVYLYGPDSIFDYRDFVNKIQNLAIEGLKLLHEKVQDEYLLSPSKFMDNIINS